MEKSCVLCSSFFVLLRKPVAHIPRNGLHTYKFSIAIIFLMPNMKAKELIQQLQKLVDRNNGEDLDISISMDISTGEEDFDNRNFGDVSEVFEQS